MSSVSLSISHQQGLGLEVKLENLFRLQASLVEREPFPNAVRGLEGMHVAHNTLVESRAVGILVGGLLEGIWNEHDSARLAEHKDVDVLIVTPNFNPEKFLNGVDWWHRKTAEIEVIGDASRLFKQQTWHENGCGEVLRFGVVTAPTQKPGLYIPNDHFLFEMRFHEVVSAVEGNGVTIDQDVRDAFAHKLSARTKGDCSSEVEQSFGRNILRCIANTSQGQVASIGDDEVVLDNFPRDVYLAIPKRPSAIRESVLDELSLPRVANL